MCRLRHRQRQAQAAEQAACMAELSTLLAEWPQEREWLCVEEAPVRRQPTLAAPWGLVDDIPARDPRGMSLPRYTCMEPWRL